MGIVGFEITRKNYTKEVKEERYNLLEDNYLY